MISDFKRKKDFITDLDFSVEEIDTVLDLVGFKTQNGHCESQPLTCVIKALVRLLFFSARTRTRSAFELRQCILALTLRSLRAARHKFLTVTPKERWEQSWGRFMMVLPSAM